MRFIRYIIKLLLVSSIAIVLVITGITLFMQIRGNDLIKETLGDIFAAKIDFQGFSIGLDKRLIVRGLSISDAIGSNRYFLDAGECALELDPDRSWKEKKLILSKVVITDGELKAAAETASGDDLLGTALTTVLASVAGFDNAVLDIEKNIIHLNGLNVSSDIGPDSYSIDVGRCDLAFDIENRAEEKMFLFDEMIIRRGKIAISRHGGIKPEAAYTYLPKIHLGIPAAHAAGTVKEFRFMDLLKNAGRITIEDSTITFTDNRISSDTFTATLESFNFAFATPSDPISSEDGIPVNCYLSFSISDGPSDRGSFYLRTDAVAFDEHVDILMETRTKRVDLIKFLPYFEEYTPFSFNEGIFSVDADLTVKNNKIDSLVTIMFHELDLVVDPDMEKARFLQASVDKLARYLMSDADEHIFDFVIKGDVSKPRMGLGPNTGFRVGLVVIGEMNKIIKTLKKDRGNI